MLGHREVICQAKSLFCSPDSGEVKRQISKASHLISRFHRDPGYRGRDRMEAHGAEWRPLAILGAGRRMLLETEVSKAQKRAEAEQG